MIEHVVQHHLLKAEGDQTPQSWDQSRNGTEEIFRRIHDVTWRLARKYSQHFNEKFFYRTV